jgi:hypothetical protein
VRPLCLIAAPWAARAGNDIKKPIELVLEARPEGGKPQRLAVWPAACGPLLYELMRSLPLALSCALDEAGNELRPGR